MANACKLSTDSIFGEELLSVMEDLSRVTNKQEMKARYIDRLKSLKTEFANDSSIEDFVESVRELIDDPYGDIRLKVLDSLEENNPDIYKNMSEVISNDYNGELSKYDPSFVESSIDIESKTEKIDNTPQEEERNKSILESIIAEYFPMASDARLSFEQRFRNNLVLALFFNDLNGPRINLSNKDMDYSIKQYRVKLSLYLDEYVKEHYPLHYEGFVQREISRKLEYFRNLMDSRDFRISSTELVKIPVVDMLSDDNLKNKLYAYMAYVALNHFDEMVESAFGKSVSILYKNNYDIGDEVKYKINLGDLNRQGWNSSGEDADETEEIGGIIRLYMESLDMYDLNGKILPFKMTFGDVKSGLGAIMNLFNSTTTNLGQTLTRNINLDTYFVNLKSQLEKLRINEFYGNGWNSIYDKYVSGKTLGQLVAQAKNKPALLMPLLFTILANNSVLFFNNRYLEKLAVYSFWKNIFDIGNPNSLINRTMNSGGINIDSADLYSFVTCLFVNIENIPVIEYRKDLDRISVSSLRQNTSNSKLNAQKYIWSAKYNVSDFSVRFKNFSISDFTGSKSITVKINNSDIELLLSENDGSASVTSSTDLSKLELTTELLSFLSEVFDVKIDQDFFDIYKSLGGTLKDLLEIAGTILYNYKVGKTIASEIKKSSSKTDREVYDDVIKNYYKGDPPSMMRGSILPELITHSIFPKVRTFSLALDIQQGYSKETTAKDGQGKQISLVGLSALSSKYMELVYNHNLGEPLSILKGFNIYDSFEDVEFVRDYAGPDNKKQATTFSEAEFFEANFLYDFYGGQVSIEKNGKYNDLRSEKANPLEPTKFRVMGPVVSDKAKLPKLRFDWRSKVTLPDGTLKRYLDLTSDDIHAIQMKEFGDYYVALHKRIHLDLDAILPYILEIIDATVGEGKEIIILDYDSDYLDFNALCEKYNINPTVLMHLALVNFLKSARESGIDDDHIKIIERIHYIQGEKNSNGHKKLHNNPALFHQLSIYGRGTLFNIALSDGYLPNLDVNTINESPEEARNRLNLLLVSELLQNEIEIVLGDNDSNTKDSATHAAELFNKDGVWRNKRVIIFAKILNGENVELNLTSLRSFLNWKEYKRLVTFLTEHGFVESNGKVRANYDVTNPKFELSTTLAAINLVKKYNIFKFKEVRSHLVDEYVNEGIGLSSSIEEIIREELLKKFPKWNQETVDEKVQEQVSSMSEEDIARKKADYWLNWGINDAIIEELNESTSEYFDFDDMLTNHVVPFIASNPEIEEKQLEKILSRIDNPVNYSIQLNPEIERYHSLNNWLGESYQLTSVGTFISHPGDKNATTIYNYEYRQFGQQVKRNVSLTASKHREVQNSIKGIRSKLRIAIMTDAEDSYITFKGDYGNDVEVHNGATFYNGTMVDLDNNSLGSDAMGLDKKPFVHAIDPKTGIGIIIKTAGFAVANSYILKSEVFARINKKMNDAIKWSDTLRKHGYSEDRYFNWLEDFHGNSLDINPIYVFREGNWYKRSDFLIDPATGETSYMEELVTDNGEVLNVVSNGRVSAGVIDSNWQLWNLFGGAYSGHFSNGELTYINDENSFKMVNYVMNHTGKVVDENIPAWDLSNVIQIVKESQIDMIPTTEAVKFGAANINDTNELLYNDDYEPTYMEIFSDDFGELLDAEHTAEGGHVSLMTLVINALGARGYSTKEAEECYRALELLAELSFEEAFDCLEILNNSSLEQQIEAKEKFKLAIANIMLSTLKNTSISDGNILSAIALGLKRFQKFGDFKQLEGTFPISSPLIYANLFSKLASAIEKAAVRLKFDGGMLVLNPSNGIFQVIDGKLLGNVSQEEVEKLLLDALSNPLKSPSDILFGRKYYVISKNVDDLIIIREPKLIDKIEDFYEIRNELLSGNMVVEAFQEGLSFNEETLDFGITGEYTPIGRDLATYGCTIKKSDSDETFSLWETDVVNLLFSWDNKTKKFKQLNNVPQTRLEVLWNLYQSGKLGVEEELLLELLKFGIKEINPDLMLKYLERSLLYTLNSISNGGIRTAVMINGLEVKVDKNGTVVSPYEAILPMIYKTSFGLRNGDSVGEIEKDKYFFVRRFRENSYSKFYLESHGNYSVDGSSFDLELKKTSGEHIYVAHTSKDLSLEEEVKIIPEVFGESLYRVDPKTRKRMYQIPSKIDSTTGQLVPNCKIYKMTNGVEVIQTNDISSVLDQGEYNSISFGDLSEKSDQDLEDIFTALELSKNRVAKNKVLYILNAITGKVKTNIEGVRKEDPTYLLAIPAEVQTEMLLNLVPEKYTSISQIFHGNGEELISINALRHHELMTKDATNLLILLNELIAALDSDKESGDETEPALTLFLKEHPHMLGIIDYGKRQHTSFLASLEAVVSRTPAQSHLSFMAMRIVGFDTNTTNSIYVSRMLLYLQGSDFDIDKANVLGLKVVNGMLTTWSPYFDLSSKERENDSEQLPFPSGRSILIKDDTNIIPWNVIDKNYLKLEILDGYAFVDNNGNIIKAITTDNGKSYSLEFIPNLENNSQNTYLLQHAIIKNFGNKIIIPNGVLDTSVFEFELDEKGVITGKFKGINVINDYKLYLDSLNLSKTNDKFDNLKDVGTLIRTFTSLRAVPSEFLDYIDIVNKHNTMFLNKDGKKDKKRDKKKRDALYNFISIKTKNISKDPINLILGQSGIDVATGDVKNLVKPGGKFDRLSSISVLSDHRSVLARMKQLVLTLTGKENVGIVASAMKVFEAMSHYYNKILSSGTLEQQERLISNVTILGRSLPMIANSFTKNPDTILSEKVYKAYLTVNNLLDAFIMMSALLSLATDNAKDPTLSKLNATPKTLGCYTAGLVLGLTIEDVADLLISDTGLLLTKMLLDDVFNPGNNKFKNLSAAIRFIETVPELPSTVDLLECYKLFGFVLDEQGNLDKNVRGNNLWSKRGRKKFKLMAMFLLNPDSFEIEKDLTKLAEKGLKDIENNPDYFGWKPENELEYKLSVGEDREKLERRYEEYKELASLRESYQAYLEDPDSMKAKRAKDIILGLQELANKLSSKENIVKLRALKNSTLGVKESLLSIFDWIRYREIVEKDNIITPDGKEHRRLANIKKLNAFNEEMGDLRTVLKLNQGLPNSVQDLLSWINTFKGILSRAVSRRNIKVKDESNTPVATFIKNYGSLDLDLNMFLNNEQYLLDAIRAYDLAKIGVNILDVMLNVPHYTGYMRTMNLLYEGGKTTSKNYATQSWIVKEILPLLYLKNLEQAEQFFKTLNPVIFERVNNNFLWQQLIELEIPKFKIVDNELIEAKNEDGTTQTLVIRLGTESGNKIFKDYCVHYLYPYLTENYPDNAFVKAISLRTYGYNLDHLISVNIAKRTSYDMNNPKSNTQFNEVKKALGKLNGVSGLVKMLFYYNLIAYNGLPGNQSLTDLFEDFFVYDTNDIITEYNKYITYLDESDVELFSEKDTDYLLRVFAPKVYSRDDISGLTYVWVTNPENNKDVLLEVTGLPSEEELEQEEELMNLESEFDQYIDDNEYDLYSRYTLYKTLKSVMDQLIAKVNSKIKNPSYRKLILEADKYLKTSSENSKRFILGLDVLFNPDIFDLIINTDSDGKIWSEFSESQKNKNLKKHKKDILLSVNGSTLNLEEVIDIAKKNGWTEKDVLDGFKFVSRKSKDHKYDILITSALKSMLDLVTNPKDC